MNRRILLTLAFALWGMAIAVSLQSVIIQPAPPGQAAGFASAAGLDARSPYRMLMAVVGLAIAVPLLLQPVARRLGDTAAQRWAANAAALAAVVALWVASFNSGLLWTLGLPALIVTACLVLRQLEARFGRRDAVLLPATLTIFLALHDITPGLSIEKVSFLAMAIVFAVRLAVAAIPSPALPGFAFAAAPLGLVLQSPFVAPDQRYLGWPSLVIAVATPFILRFFLRNERTAANLLSFVVYPVALYSYATAISLVSAEGKPRVNFFESGHGLLPASEMLRGEMPYRDILPAHGLFEDGLFDYLVLRTREPTIGSVLEARFFVTELNVIAVYALATAATGVPEVGLATPFLAFLTGYRSVGLRELPALIALTIIVLAVRRRRTRYFAFAGAMIVVCGFTSLDFAAYTFLALLFAVARYPSRVQALRAAAIGLSAAAVPALLALAVSGIAVDFFRGTFVEVLTLGPVYALQPFNAPEMLKRKAAIPEIVAALLDLNSFLYVCWFLVLIYLSVAIARSPLRGRRRHEPLIIIAAWIIFAGISYAERHHLYFRYEVLALTAVMIFRLFRRRSLLAPVALILLLTMARPTAHVAIAGALRNARGPIDTGFVELQEPPRARGALFWRDDANVVVAAKRYLDRMPRDQTFFDFTNRLNLHFLFDRDCPIRQYEVPFYQTEERQKEVIQRLETNRQIQAALMPLWPEHESIDRVPNAERAPLVWKYLQENFEPDFQEGMVSFWRRKQ